MVATLRIQLLGGFRLHTDETPVTTLDQPRLQALLAYLVLHRAAPQSRQHLAFLLWPDSTEAQARTNLRSLLHHLRQALPDADTLLHIDAQLVQWRAGGPATVDVAAFEGALAQASQAMRHGDQLALLAALQAAVELYTGDLLPGWYDDWLLAERERLRQAVLDALEQLVVMLEGAREYAAAIGYAQLLLRHDPLREAAYQHLMRLHALSGDRASAVRIYHTCTTVLERELAVEPSQATRDAYERLRQFQPPQARPLVPTVPLTPIARRHNLPIALTSFIGRTQEVAEVARLLAGTRLLTLTGAGGCGKTRLALVVAAEPVATYPDGVWLVELAALADSALLPQAVATMLGVREQPQQALIATLIDTLQAKALLLVLDNCEHQVGACAELVVALLGACPRLQILATSREPLSVAGETTWRVPSLALPDPRQLPTFEALRQVEAVRLFVERAAAALPTFTLTQANAAVVAQVCLRLDGIPLALELAAARVKVVSVEQLAARLDDSMRVLTGGSRTALPHHQTLRAAIDWSYDLLTEQEQALFRRLAVFAGGWSLEAAESVCADAEIAANEVLELLAHLVDKSLVVVEPQDDMAVRYRLLEPLRQYAQAKLRECGDLEAVQQRHVRFFRALAEAAEPALHGLQQAVWLRRLETEHSNLRAALHEALDQGDVGTAVHISWGLWYFWFIRGQLSEGHGWIDAALAQGSALSGLERARALMIAGILDYLQGQLERLAQLSNEALVLFQEAGDRFGEALALLGLGMGAVFRRDFAQATACFEASLALCRGLGDRWAIALALNTLGQFELMRGDTERANVALEESVALFAAIGDRGYSPYTLHNLALTLLPRGERRKAATLLVQGLRLSVQMGNKVVQSRCLAALAAVAALAAQPEQAARLWGAADALRKTLSVSLTAPLEETLYEPYHAAARAQLGEAAFAAAWAEGRALPIEQAVAEALGVADATMADAP